MVGRRVAGLVALSVVLAPAPPPPIPVTLGGGSGIVVDGDAFCTLTTIGHDNRGDLIGFTSAHCGGPGARSPPRAPRTQAPSARWWPATTRSTMR